MKLFWPAILPLTITPLMVALAGAALPAAAADLLSPVPVARQAPAKSDKPWLHVWTGLSVAPGSLWGYAGMVAPLHGNLWVDDILFRAEIGLGRYRHTGGGFNNIGVDHYSGDLMVGYQKAFGATWVTGYVGANFQQDGNPDPAAAVRGSQWGVKGQAEVYAPLSKTLFLYSMGSYSTAFSTYAASAKLGFRLAEKLSVGPEIATLGNDGFGQLRIGAAAAFGVGVGVDALGELILSAGYAYTTAGNGTDGPYAGVHFRTLLH